MTDERGLMEAALEHDVLHALRHHDRRTEHGHALAVYWLWELGYTDEAEYAATHPIELEAVLALWRAKA